MTDPFLAAFDALFQGRRDVYADGYPDPERPEKYRYAAVRAPLTAQVLLSHLRGEQFIGMYQMLDDSTVGWFCCDFDAPKDADGHEVPDPYPLAWAAAQAQLDAFQRAGLQVYAERSRSGKGVHVWGFLEALQPAKLVRDALRPLIVRDETFDRMYPVQDWVTSKKPFGNLIGLPFHGGSVPAGNTVFLNLDGHPTPPREFVQQVRRNRPAVLEELARKAPKQRQRVAPTKSALHLLGGNSLRNEAPDYGPTIPGALKVVSPYGCSFMRHCYTDRKGLAEPKWSAALQVAAHFDHGRDFAHLLSMGDPRYDAGIVDARFDRALAESRIGCQWIHENYPQLACESCPMKAPHYLAKQSILELAAGKRDDMEQVGSFAPDLARVRERQDGKARAGVAWGIPGFDDVTRLRNGEFIAIGAMQSMGKTWFFVNAVVALARQGIPIMGFSAETGEESFRVRLLANAAKVDSRKLTGEHHDKLSNAEWARVEAAADELSRLPIFIDYTSLTADDVLAQCESVVLQNRIPLDQPYVIFFDYLQFGAKMATDASEYDRLSRLSTEFKFTAKILWKPVVVFSQVRRDKEGNETPDMTWWKGTGRIESDQDVGIIWVGERMQGEYAPRTAWFTKQREGLANFSLNYTLQQSYGDFRFVGDRAPEPLGPLLPAGPDPLLD